MLAAAAMAAVLPPHSALHGRRRRSSAVVLHLELPHAFRQVLDLHLVLFPLGSQQLGRLGVGGVVCRSKMTGSGRSVAKPAQMSETVLQVMARLHGGGRRLGWCRGVGAHRGMLAL